MKRYLCLLGLCFFITNTGFAKKPVMVASFKNSKVPVMVDADWLKGHLHNKSLIVVDMSDAIQYQRFHIKNAVHLGYHQIVRKLKNGVSLRLVDQQLYKVLGAHGIRPDHYVILYDDIGGLNAARLFWELERIGHEKVSVLDGGLVTWILKGYPVDNRIVRTHPVVYRANPMKTHVPNEISFKALQSLNFKTTTLLDVRSKDEYQGHKKVKKSGHIPGAKWWPWDYSVDFNHGFRHRPDQLLQHSLEKLGVKKTTDKLVVYCRSGHRAAQSYLTLRKLGYKNIKLYDGSILEYSKNPNVVLKKGIQP